MPGLPCKAKQLKKIQRRGFLLGISLCIVLPFLPLFLWAFTQQWFYPALWPQKFGLASWHYLFGAGWSQVLEGLFYSTCLATATAILAVLLGLPAGRALGLSGFPGKKLCMLLLSLSFLLPQLSISMGLHLWFIQLHLAETFLGVLLLHLGFALPYAIFVFHGIFTTYPLAFEEQARTLGASRVQVIFQVMLPLLLPGLVTASFFTFLLSWSQYLSTIIIGGGRFLTLPMLLFSLADSGDHRVSAAMSLFFLLPIALTLFLAFLTGHVFLADQRKKPENDVSYQD